MNSSDQFTLKWTDFQENIAKSFKDLRNEDDFADVTLVCEDSQQILAHKLILSVSSPLFKSMFKKSKHPNPLVYMRGIKSKHMLSIVNYIYHGEARVYQEDLEGFLEIAQELGLPGLQRTETTDKTELTREIKPKTQRQVKKKLHGTTNFPNKINLQEQVAMKKEDDSLQEIPEQEFSNIIEQAFGKQVAFKVPAGTQLIGVGKMQTKMKEDKPESEVASKPEPVPVATQPCHICRKMFTTRIEVRDHVMKSPVCRGF